MQPEKPVEGSAKPATSERLSDSDFVAALAWKFKTEPGTLTWYAYERLMIISRRLRESPLHEDSSSVRVV
jgi:hypothetical protein